MKLALIILHADPARGGAERYTLDLAHGLRGRGHEVEIVASSFGQGAKTDRDVALDAGGGTRSGRYLRFLDELERHIAAARYDLVHAMLPVRHCDLYHPHAGIAAESLAAGHLKYEGRIMQELSQFATQLNRRRQLFGKVERGLLGPLPPVVLCLSDYIKRSVRQHYAIDESRLVTLFNAVDLNRFDPRAAASPRQQTRERLGIGGDQVAGLIIANDFERKGLREAIIAAARIRDSRLTLLVVGKEDTRIYQTLAAREKAQNIIFAGPAADPYPLYAAADFFVLPTRHDPCSLVVLEALAMNLPVISTIFNGACEIMTDGRHGVILSDPADLTNLAGAMREMLDPARRAAMVYACQELRPRLALGRHLDALEEIYRRELASREM